MVLIVLTFAGPRFRAGKNFLPEILGRLCVFLGRKLLSPVDLCAGVQFWCRILKEEPI